MLRGSDDPPPPPLRPRSARLVTPDGPPIVVADARGVAMTDDELKQEARPIAVGDALFYNGIRGRVARIDDANGAWTEWADGHVDETPWELSRHAHAVVLRKWRAAADALGIVDAPSNSDEVKRLRAELAEAAAALAELQRTVATAVECLRADGSAGNVERVCGLLEITAAPVEPVVCPGCYSVDDEPCKPGCIDDAMRREREDEYARGPSDDESEDDANG